MKVLQFSHFNTVGVPWEFRQLYIQKGIACRLLTLFPHRGGFPEDICLNKKPFSPKWLQHRRARRMEDGRRAISQTNQVLPFRPRGLMERLIIDLRDAIRMLEFRRMAARYRLMDFDLYHFHGGAGFFRGSRWVRNLFKAGKGIICHYHGPDLRVRGIVEEVDACSSLNFTNEFDLLALHENLHYIPIPFDSSHLPSPLTSGNSGPLRILHCPSDPEVKGTKTIKKILEKISQTKRVQFRILTGVPRQVVLEEKRRCHIAIDQIGNLGGTGYGVNSLESLAMGIPTLTDFTPEYHEFLSGHPFVLARADTLEAVLLDLIDRPDLRASVGENGRRWVAEHHGYDNVWKVMMEQIRKHLPHAARTIQQAVAVKANSPKN